MRSSPRTLSSTLGLKGLKRKYSSRNSTPVGAEEKGGPMEGGGISAAVTFKERKETEVSAVLYGAFGEFILSLFCDETQELAVRGGTIRIQYKAPKLLRRVVVGLLMNNFVSLSW